MVGLLGEGSGCTQEPVGVAGQLTAKFINFLLSLRHLVCGVQGGLTQGVVPTQSDLGAMGEESLTDRVSWNLKSKSFLWLNSVL